MDVDVYIWDSTGKMELITSEHFISISADSGDTVAFNWDTLDKAGTNKIIVVLDPGKSRSVNRVRQITLLRKNLWLQRMKVFSSLRI